MNKISFRVLRRCLDCLPLFNSDKKKYINGYRGQNFEFFYMLHTFINAYT